MSTTLQDLDRLAIDDIEVAAPDDYIDSSLPTLVPEGTYLLAITDWDVSRNRETKAPDGKAVIVNLEVLDGPEEGMSVRNLRVWTATYERHGVKVSGLGDLIRALDPTARWRTIGEACTILQKAKDQREPFRAKLLWEAFDRDWFDEQGGNRMTPKSPEQKALRKQATIRGMRHFRQAPDGTYLPVVDGPSGNEIEARVGIDRYYPKR